ncbi:MAG: hypothetical protein ACI84K_000388 [Pseudohongiellaceae bacterium]|jgi:hypothetical protein
MFKILFLVVPVIAMIVAQSLFIYGIDSGGSKQHLELWNSFNINQTDYSKFVFSTIKVWWALPVACVIGLVLSLYYSLKKLAFLAFVFSLVGTVALYWSAYAPELMIKI